MSSSEQSPISPNEGNATASVPLYFDNDIHKESEPFNTRGGFGDLFIGQHPNLGKVALKRLKGGASSLKMMTKEAGLWRTLSHPYVLAFYGVLMADGDVYIISPFVENGALNDYLADHPDADRFSIMWEIADGIAYLHEKGVIHGDIKAGNVLVSKDLKCLLCDFGLSKTTGTDTTASLAGMGTLRWQAPELMDGSRKTPASDVYAFAITVYEVLSGDVPFLEQQTEAAIITAIFVKRQRPRPEPAASSSGVSYQPLWKVAQRCWSHEPDDRGSMREAANELRLLLPPSGAPMSPAIDSGADVNPIPAEVLNPAGKTLSSLPEMQMGRTLSSSSSDIPQVASPEPMSNPLSPANPPSSPPNVAMHPGYVPPASPPHTPPPMIGTRTGTMLVGRSTPVAPSASNLWSSSVTGSLSRVKSSKVASLTKGLTSTLLGDSPAATPPMSPPLPSSIPMTPGSSNALVRQVSKPAHVSPNTIQKNPELYAQLVKDALSRNEWMTVQESTSEAFLARYADREVLRNVISQSKDLRNAFVPEAPFRAGDGRWYWKTSKEPSHAIYRSLDTNLPRADNDSELFFDPARVTPAGTTVGEREHSPCGRYFAFTLHGPNGASIIVQNASTPLQAPGDLQRGGCIVDVVDGLSADTPLAWVADSGGLFYTTFGPVTNKKDFDGQPHRDFILRYRSLTGKVSIDVLRLTEENRRASCSKLQLTEPDGRYLAINLYFASKNHSKQSAFWIGDMGSNQLPSKIEWHHLLNSNTETMYSLVTNDGPKFYVYTDQDAPLKKVVTVALQAKSISFIKTTFDKYNPLNRPTDFVPIMPRPGVELTGFVCVNREVFVATFRNPAGLNEICVISALGILSHVVNSYSEQLIVSGASKHQPFFFVKSTEMLSKSVVRKYDFKNNGIDRFAVDASVWRDAFIPSLGGLPSEGFTLEEVSPLSGTAGQYLTMYILRHRDSPWDGNRPCVLIEWTSFAYAPALLTFCKVYQATIVILRRLQGHELRCAQEDFVVAMDFITLKNYGRPDKMAIVAEARRLGHTLKKYRMGAVVALMEEQDTRPLGFNGKEFIGPTLWLLRTSNTGYHSHLDYIKALQSQTSDPQILRVSLWRELEGTEGSHQMAEIDEETDLYGFIAHVLSLQQTG